MGFAVEATWRLDLHLLAHVCASSYTYARTFSRLLIQSLLVRKPHFFHAVHVCGRVLSPCVFVGQSQDELSSVALRAFGSTFSRSSRFSSNHLTSKQFLTSSHFISHMPIFSQLPHILSYLFYIFSPLYILFPLFASSHTLPCFSQLFSFFHESHIEINCVQTLDPRSRATQRPVVNSLKDLKELK